MAFVLRGISAAALLALALVPACLAPIDLTGRMCPCDEGWTCDSRNRCVRDDVDGGGIDGGERDVGPRDVGTDVPIDGFVPVDVGMDDVSMDVPVVPDAPVFTVCPPGARLCDDFESAETDRIPPWDWSVGPPARSTAEHVRGAAAGFFSVPGGPTPGEHSVGIDTDPTTTELWLRFWAFVPTAAMPLGVGVTAVSGGAPDFANTSILINDGGWAFYSTVSATYRGGLPVTRDVWTCVSLHVAFGSTGRIDLFVDGSGTLSADVDTAFAMGLQGISSGITYVDAVQTAPFSIYLDDETITLDGTPLVCP